MKHSKGTVRKAMPRLCSLSTKKRHIVTLALAAGAALATFASTDTAHADELPQAAAPAPQPSAMAEARKQFQAGVNLLDDPDGAKYEEAYDAFK